MGELESLRNLREEEEEKKRRGPGRILGQGLSPGPPLPWWL